MHTNFQQTRTNGRASIRGSPTIRTVLAALWWRRWLSCGGIKQNAWTDYCLQKWPIDPFGSVLWNILWCSTFCIRSNSPISILFLFNSTIKNYTSISLNTLHFSLYFELHTHSCMIGDFNIMFISIQRWDNKMVNSITESINSYASSR